MKASITFHEDTSKVIWPQVATGHMLRVLINRDESVAMLVSDRDHGKVEELLGEPGDGSWRRITDLITGEKHRLVRADCGLGCRCAVAIAGF